MAGSSYSYNDSSGQSTSTSTPVQTPQSLWGLQLSQLLNVISQNQLAWADQQFNNGMGVTTQNINNFMSLAGKGEGLANNLIEQYKDTIAPLIDSYVKDAGTYASEARQRFEAGKAESTVAQASQQARDEAERKLQGFGINPNSGRYQDLMLTSRIQDAAARAGAGTEASLNTADRGRAMKEKAIAMGQNEPGMAVNALQNAMSGVTGAENAILGMLNTGANIRNPAAQFAGTAATANRLPTNGTNAQSTNNSQGRSVSAQSDPARNSGDKSSNPRQSGEGNGNNRQPNQGSSPSAGGINPKTMHGPFQPDSGRKDVDGNEGQDGASPMPYFDEKGNLTPYGDPMTARDPSGNIYTPETTPWNDLPQSPNWLPQNSDFPGFTGQYNQDPNSFQPTDIQNPGDTWMGPQGDFPTSQPQQQPDPNAFDQPQQPFDNFGYNPGGDQDFGGGGGSPWDMQLPDTSDYGGYTPDEQPVDDYGYTPQEPNNFDGQDFGTPDYSYQPQDYSGDGGSSFDESGFDDYGGDYARGGSVRRPQRRGPPTTGGPVPRGASPSRGKVTDDVKARLNAGEFVVPRDVVQDKGTGFFHSLIAKSRRARTGLSGPPARAKMRTPLPAGQATTFRSRPMGAR